MAPPFGLAQLKGLRAMKRGAGKTELPTTTALDQILANLAKAMVDMIFLCFPGFGYLP